MDTFLIITVIALVIIIIILLIHFYLKKDELKKEINSKSKLIETLNQNHIKEINHLKTRLNNLDEPDIHLISSEFYDIISYYGLKNNRLFDINFDYNKTISKDAFVKAINSKYKLEYIFYLYPELKDLFADGNNPKIPAPIVMDTRERTRSLFDIIDALNAGKSLSYINLKLKNRVNFLEASQSNLTAIPYMAALVADYETYGLEELAKKLDWGSSQERLKKVKSIREIRKDAQAMVEKNKESQYQLAYLINLFPALEDIIESDYNQLPAIKVTGLSEYDSAKDWLTQEEYNSLSTTERNQLALDRYKQSKNKSKWQIGRDYEFYVGYKYSQKGYNVDYYGSYKGLEDLGRDLIAKLGGMTLIIQCKYWSSKKQIHEKHIMQLYGTAVGYCIENAIPVDSVKRILITNIELSETAKKYAEYLNVQYKEKYPMGEYPCIKCNIGHNEQGSPEKIYHLPFDQKYDATKIDKPGEFFAMTVKEAENAGFRRAFKRFNS